MTRAATSAAGSLPTRNDFARLTCRVIESGSATKAAIRLLDWQSEPAGARFTVVKDVAPLHPLLRCVYGRRVLRREERVLAALAGAPGVPRLYGRIDADAIAMEFIDAEPIGSHLAPERLRRACVELGPRVEMLHERGIVHLDLRQKRNVLVGAQGDVFLIDFQSAFVLQGGGPGALLRRWLARFDRGAVLKFRARYAPELLSEAEQVQARRARILGRFWFFHRFGPFLRWLFGRRPRARSP